MIAVDQLPAVNATLNMIAFVFLLTGYRFIRQRRVTAHKRCMIAAFTVSILFLMSYLTYRFIAGDKKFGGAGFIRPIYFFILITHVSLALMVPFLAAWTLVLGLRGRFEKHRWWARITFPVWVYVSITGVIVYVMLFQIYGPVAASG
jgi:uncharacterized membrane protein YozB (DUF420 family)